MRTHVLSECSQHCFERNGERTSMQHAPPMRSRTLVSTVEGLNQCVYSLVSYNVLTNRTGTLSGGGSRTTCYYTKHAAMYR